MKFIKDKLDKSYLYPCTIKEIKNFLRLIPQKDLEGIKSIRFSNQKTNVDGGCLVDGRLEIICFVDKEYRKRIYGSGLGEKFINDIKRFGGVIKYIDGNSYICWTPEKLKKYIQYVLYHEIGHHVYNLKYGKIGDNPDGEKFCDRYAFKYLRT